MACLVRPSESFRYFASSKAELRFHWNFLRKRKYFLDCFVAFHNYQILTLLLTENNEIRDLRIIVAGGRNNTKTHLRAGQGCKSYSNFNFKCFERDFDHRTAGAGAVKRNRYFLNML